MFSNLISRYTLMKSSFISNVFRYSSSSKLKDSVFVVDGGKTILCYHPERPHPYEHSKEIIHEKDHQQEEDSILKIQLHKEAQQLHRNPKYPTPVDLQKMTYTTKHRWFKKPQLKYKKPNPPRDREGI